MRKGGIYTQQVREDNWTKVQLVRAGQKTPTGGEGKGRETETKGGRVTTSTTQGNTSTNPSTPGNRHS